MTPRAVRDFTSLVEQMKTFAQTEAPVDDSDFMRGYSAGCSNAYRMAAEWVTELLDQNGLLDEEVAS